MTTDQGKYAVQKLKRRYLSLRLIEISLFSISLGLFVFAVTRLYSAEIVSRLSLSCAVAVGASILLGKHYKILRLKPVFFTRYLNRHFPQLNESADLLLASDGTLSWLQLIQKERVFLLLRQILPDVRFPHRIPQSVTVFILCGCLSVFSLLIPPLGKYKIQLPVKKISSDESMQSTVIKSFRINVSPPSYTQLKSFESTDFHLSLPEGSSVKWAATFSGEPINAKIFFSGKDSVILVKQDSLTFSLDRQVHESGFYQVQWSDRKKNYRSDFYRIEVVKDQAPKIAIKDLNQFTKLKFTDQLNVTVKTELIDDYGLSDAQIVATVSKGSGEGVKFREEKLRFTSPPVIIGKKLEATRVLDLKKLGLEPADELYFYVEARDNKGSLPNRSRTETFFIAIQDTASEITSVDAGLGVDLMPEYFRSQRQIIIDTEKLLRDKKNISGQQFKATSNELGYDQKALRLRYGQFSGEEDEAGIGQPVGTQADEENDDPLKNVSHQHDTKNEHNLVDQKAKQHPHAESENSEDEKNPLRQFVHEHDNSEEATFFIQSLKTKLKAAITQMWDAELYLRLYQPEKSLPYQYNALNLLKEISSDSRIFVHRSGFDPPPLKEEKRLTADLSEVTNGRDFLKTRREDLWPGVKDALFTIENMISQRVTTASINDQKTFRRAGEELARLASEKPMIFLKGLSLLKSLSENQTSISTAELVQLRTILWKALPPPMPSPHQRQATGHALNKLFLNNLDQEKHE